MNTIMEVASKYPRWVEPIGVDLEKAEHLAKELNISLPLAQLLFAEALPHSMPQRNSFVPR